MNLLHVKYALAIAKTKSINKAAEELLVGAPALSRAIKELENSVGVTIFTRSAQGMELTPDGEQLLFYAEKAMKQLDDIETYFKEGRKTKLQFSVSVPRASYISDAFTKMSARIDPKSDTELFYKETNARRVISQMLKEDYKLGILRYAAKYEGYYKELLQEKGLLAETINEFSYVLVMSKKSPLAQIKDIKFEDLNGYIEIAHADPYVPSIPMSEVKKEELPDHDGARIFVFERASQLELLSENPNTYMWVSSTHQELLNRFDLVEKPCGENQKIYKDVLIYREGYKLTELDRMFMEELEAARKRTFA